MALLSTDGAAAASACAAPRLGCVAIAIAAARKDDGRRVRRTPQLTVVNILRPLLSSRAKFVDLSGPRLTRISLEPQANF